MKKLVCLVVVFGACKKPPPAVAATGISASVVFTGTVTQFSFEAFNGTAVVGPSKTEPATAGAALKSPYATDFEFDDSLGGQTVRISAQALSAGATVAVANASVKLVKGVLTPLTITLVAPACGDGILTAPEQCDDGNTVAGDGCSATCQIETAANAVCGNAILEPGETCDIGAATSPGCAACVLTAGWTCTATSCSDGNCGNGVIDPGETCDDGNTATGDGCDGSCQIEIATPQWTCSGTPSCCQRCGDNKRQCSEQCDGTDFSDPNDPTITFSCLAAGQLNAGVAGTNSLGCVSCAFDGSNCAVPTALNRIDTVANLKQAIAQAIQIPGHDIISVVGGVLPLTIPSGSPIIIQEGNPPAGMTFEPLNFGMPGYKSVTFTTPNAGTNDEMFVVDTGHNVFLGLDFVMNAGTLAAIDLTTDGTISSNFNTILGCTFDRPTPSGSPTVGTWSFLAVGSDSNTILANSFDNEWTSVAGSSAIDISGGSKNEVRLNAIINGASATETTGLIVENVPAGATASANDIEDNYFASSNAASGETAILVYGAVQTRVAMNLIEGKFANGIEVSNSADTTSIDNNSIYATTTSAPVFFNGATLNNCYRNNIVYSSQPLLLANIGSGAFTGACGGTATGNNVLNPAGGQQCGTTGSGDCSNLCEGAASSPHPFCDLNPAIPADLNYAAATGPTTIPALCLPAGSSLIDKGVLVSCNGGPCYDMIDTPPTPFLGKAPEVGARESGGARTYGVPGNPPAPIGGAGATTITSTCP